MLTSDNEVASRSLRLLKISFRLALTGALITIPAQSQEQAAAPVTGALVKQAPPPDSKEPSKAVPPNYTLGPQDQIGIWSLNTEEFTGKPVPIDMTGDINLPLVGRVHAAGLTPQQLESEVSKRMAKYVKTPQISVTVTEFRSQPVSVIGAVNNPGVQQLRGNSTLLQVLSSAGGLRQDAGNSLKITRKVEYGSLPLKSSKLDSTKQFAIADVSIRSLMAAQNPEENITVQPYDVISVPRADLVYVVGEVTKAGGFVLNERERLSVLQALSLAGGLSRYAAASNAKILRPMKKNGDNPGTTEERDEIAVNLKDILRGKASDVPMRSDDILFIPGSESKRAMARAADFTLQTLSTLPIVLTRY